MTSMAIFSRNSLGARSGKQAGYGINSYPFRSTASIASVDSRVLLSKNSNMRTLFASKDTVAIALLADGCVLNVLGVGDPRPTY